MPEPALLWAPRAWTPDGWREQVVLRAGGDGRWAEVTPDIARPPPDAQVLAGPLLPSLVNAHSHAFQRAFAGHAERRDAASDDFWSWRDRMYRVALRLSPAQLRDVAAQLYVELLKGGYTQVCEFHYLQRDVDGRPYADPLAMSWALAEAAAETGIGLTLLPVLYERAGFGTPLRDDQRRFRASAAEVWQAAAAIAAAGRPLLGAGLAIHSLRAARPESIAELRRLAEGFAGPIHIHVAEQTAEVRDCVATTGARPIEWLARGRLLDARWQLVHATHSRRRRDRRGGAERRRRRALPEHRGEPRRRPGRPARLARRRRAADDRLRQPRHPRLARRAALAGVRPAPVAAAAQRRGRAAGGTDVERRAPVRPHPRRQRRRRGRIALGPRAGARADALVVDRDEDALLGLPPSHTLDALVFSSPGRSWRDVLVAGRWVIRDRVHAGAPAIAERFAATMHALG